MAHNPYKAPEYEAKLPRWKSNLPAIALRVLVVVGFLGVVVALLLPARRTGGREAARRMQCNNHLKQIASALQNYEATYSAFPPAYTVDATGKPLHSWRTLLLPFIAQQAPYHKIDLTKPWDDPANREAYKTRVRLYECPSNEMREDHTTFTTYFAVVAPGGCFKSSQSTPFAAIKDRRDLTLMVIEVPEKHAVHWMSPQDATEEMILNRRASAELSHSNGSHAAFADGRLEFLIVNIRPEVLRALISIDGNDDVIAADHP